MNRIAPFLSGWSSVAPPRPYPLRSFPAGDTARRPRGRSSPGDGYGPGDGLGLRALPAKTPDLAHGLLRVAATRIGAVVVPSDLAVVNLRNALDALRRQAPAHEIAFLGAGRDPGNDGRSRMREAGVKLAIFPASGFLAMGAALRSIYGEIRNNGSTKHWDGELYDFGDFSRLMGFERIWAFEREHVES